MQNKEKSTQNQILDKEGKIDLPLLLIAIGLSIFGVVMVYSASSYSAQYTYDDQYFFLKKQLIGLILGSIAMVGMAFVSYKFLDRIKIPILIVSFALLIAVFIPFIGVENYGARRWIQLPGFTMQASEVAKFGFIIFTSSYMAKNHARMQSFVGILPILLIGGATAFLIILEPNMSITICIVLLMMVMLFAGGARIKHFALLSVPIVALIPILIAIEPYRMKRLVAFIDPWANPQGEGFQLIQSLYALGSGGWFGVGLFNSRQKYLFLPFAESDFIFAIIGEELGLVGCFLLLSVYVLLIARIVKIALHAPNRFSSYLATGIAGIIGIQTVVNIAVVTGSIPPTGLPLPFISSGSTSLVIFLASIGIVLNISRHQNKGKADYKS